VVGYFEQGFYHICGILSTTYEKRKRKKRMRSKCIQKKNLVETIRGSAHTAKFFTRFHLSVIRRGFRNTSNIEQMNKNPKKKKKKKKRTKITLQKAQSPEGR
jgi:hypothetical protein